MASVTPKISVVVPFHNVEPYLGDCLESLAGQTFRDLEVIMVDDGSTDGSAVVAKSFAERDHRFRLLQQLNRGPGPARNTGVAAATGEYLGFVDGDDMVARFAYELLARTLNDTGSQVAAGGVRRISAAGVKASWVHTKPFARTRLRTHISRDPLLFQDRTPWNKLFRRSFWDEHGFEFPAGLYEDPPVTLPAHVLASTVDVLSDPIYFWRVRDVGELSTTQRRNEMSNLEDRVASLHRVADFLDERAPGLRADFDHAMLRLDLNVLLEALAVAAEADRDRVLDLAHSYIERIDPAVFESLTAMKRLKYLFVRQREVADFLEVTRFERTGFARSRIVRRGRIRPRWYAEYPFFRDRERAIPDSVFDVTKELVLHAQVDHVDWRGDRLRIEGHAMIPRLDMTHADELKVWLAHEGSDRRVEPVVERIRRPDVTATSKMSAACYDGSGFAIEVDPEELRINDRWAGADWTLHVSVQAQGLTRSGPVIARGPGSPQWPPHRAVRDDVWVRPTGDKTVQVRVRRLKALVTGCREDAGELEFTGWTKVRGKGPQTVTVALRQGFAKVVVPMRMSIDGAFRFRVPLADLVVESGVADDIARTAQIGEGVHWDFSMDLGPGKTPLRLAVLDGLESRHLVGSREIAVTRTRYGNLTAVERAPRLVITEVGWTVEGRLRFGGRHAAGPGEPTELVVRRRRSGQEHRFPFRAYGGREAGRGGTRFVAEFDPGRIGFPAESRPLASGDWDLLVRRGGGETSLVAERGLLGRLPDWRITGGHRTRVCGHQGDGLHLQVRLALEDGERGAYGQRRLRERFYAALVAGPRRDLVVFNSYGGARYACHPRALYEELVRRDLPLDYVWLSQDGQFEVPGPGRSVLMGSRDHYEALARARYLIGNWSLPEWVRKPADQVYLQTMHGAPFKRAGYDLREMPFQRVEALEWMDYEVPRWDYFISPSPFATKVLRRCFRYEGEMIESGHPRNDILFDAERGDIAQRVRRRLGIPPGKKVVLYAPTWRDDLQVAAGKRLFNLELDVLRMRAALGDDHVLLLRAHYFVTDRNAAAAADGFVIDVTGHPDIAELYLAADVLITDYSSAMFDFAVTRKPILFFTYDLERYRDDVRGFYFDLEAAAPGPLLRTTDEVTDALRDLPPVTGAYADAYRKFLAKYCPWDDGRASARVIDRIFGGE